MQNAIRTLIDVGETIPKEVEPPFISKKVEKVLEFIFKIMTQLRVVSGMSSSVLGFDYVAVAETAKIYNFKLNANTMDMIRLVEKRIVEEYNNKGE